MPEDEVGQEISHRSKLEVHRSPDFEKLVAEKSPIEAAGMNAEHGILSPLAASPDRLGLTPMEVAAIEKYAGIVGDRAENEARELASQNPISLVKSRLSEAADAARARTDPQGRQSWDDKDIELACERLITQLEGQEDKIPNADKGGLDMQVAGVNRWGISPLVLQKGGSADGNLALAQGMARILGVDESEIDKLNIKDIQKREKWSFSHPAPTPGIIRDDVFATEALPTAIPDVTAKFVSVRAKRIEGLNNSNLPREQFGLTLNFSPEAVKRMGGKSS